MRERPAPARPWLRAVLIEAAAVVVVVFAGFTVLGHIVSSDWAGVFFANGDSLVLALIEKSTQEGQAFEWVFSSQVFLFPEGLLFLLSTLFVDDPRVALLVNAVLNLVVLYALLRLAAHFLAGRSRHRFVEISIALATTVLFTVYILLEPIASPNRSGIATPFVFTTYNAGVTMGGLALVVLSLWLTRAFRGDALPKRRIAVFAALAVALVALVAFSNALFLFEVIAPLWLTLLVLVFLTRLRWSEFGIVVGSTAVGVLVALLARALAPQLFAAEVARYVALSQIPTSLYNLWLTFVETASTPEGLFKLVLVGSFLLLDGVLLVFALYAQPRPALAARLTDVEVFVVVFVAVSALSLVAGQVLTGTTTNRYLQPLFVFPLLTAVALGVYVLRRLLSEVERAELRRSLARFATGLAVACSALVVVGGAVSLPASAAAVAAPDPAAADCLDDVLDATGSDAVGSFWSTRALELYGESEHEVLQVTPDFDVFAWMINLAAYDDLEVGAVVVDGSEGFSIAEVEDRLGEPARVVACPGYEVWDYAGTPVAQQLSEQVAESLEELRSER